MKSYRSISAEFVLEGGLALKIRGYAAVFNSLSERLNPPGEKAFHEVIRPGAFAKSLTKDIRALAHHDSAFVLGRLSNGTLKLEEDSRGLRFEIVPPDTSYARDLMESIRRGDIAGASFGFWESSSRSNFREEPGKVIRELHEIDLFEISPVAMPAYPATEGSVIVRSFEDYISSRDISQEKTLEKLALLRRLNRLRGV